MKKKKKIHRNKRSMRAESAVHGWQQQQQQQQKKTVHEL